MDLKEVSYSTKNTVSPMATRWLWGFFLAMCLIFMISGYFRQNENYAKSFEYLETQKIKTLVKENQLKKAQDMLIIVNMTASDKNNLHILYANALVAFESGEIQLAKQYLGLDINHNFHTEEENYKKFKEQLNSLK